MAELKVGNSVKVKLAHPESKDVKEFEYGHAKNIIKRQFDKKHKPAQSWTLVDGQGLSIDKEGNLIQGTNTAKSDTNTGAGK